MDLGIRLSRTDEYPLYVQAADAIRSRIESGDLRAGDRLPSVRRLSDDLAVNPATIAAAYRILAREGYVGSRAGSGIFVTGSPSARADSTSAVPVPQAGKSARTGAIVDFAGNAPPRESFPLETFKRLMLECIDADMGGAFEYQDPAGYGPLRETLAARLTRFAPGAVGPDDVYIVSGAQQGLHLAARLLLRRGDVAVVEAPGYKGARDVFLAAGARLEAVPLDGEGLDLDALERVARSRPLRLVYANPTCQNPTGITYSASVRERLAELAARYGFYVVEDDPLSELVYDGGPPPPVRAHDDSGRVLYLKSFSKTVMPGLRIACLEAPPEFSPRLGALKRADDISSNGLMQRVLERFLSSDLYERHLEALVAHCRSMEARFEEALAPYRAHGLSWTRPSGGFSAWVRLPVPGTGAAVQAQALAAGIAVESEQGVRPEGARGPDDHLRISFATARSAEVADAVRALGALASG